MEVDISLKAKDVAVLVYHPHMKQRARKKRTAAGEEGEDSEKLGEPPMSEPLLREQHSGGSVTVSESEGQINTEEAIQRRNNLRLPPLAAVFTFEVKGARVGLMHKVSEYFIGL